MACINIIGHVREIVPRVLALARPVRPPPGYEGPARLVLPPDARALIADVTEVVHALSGMVRPGDLNGRVQQLHRLFEHAEGAFYARRNGLQRLIRDARRSGIPEGELPTIVELPPNALPSTVSEIASDLVHLSQHANRDAFLTLIEEMSRSRSFFYGGQGVLDIVRRFGFQRVRNLELSIRVEASRRVYDVVINHGAHRLLVEVKNWSTVVGLPNTRWNHAADQLLRDFRSREQVYWIFRTAPEETSRPAIRDAMRRGMARGTAERGQVRAGLTGGVQRMLLREAVQSQAVVGDAISIGRLINLLESITDTASLERLVKPRSRQMFATNGQFDARKARRYINQLRQFFDNFNARVFINPG